jgi:hypothetical protein
LNFQLIASGPTFDVDGFLAATGLSCDRVFRRGETVGAGGNTTYKSSGFSRVLGKAAELSFEQQVEVAGRFVDEHRELLSRLSAWPGLERAKILLSPEARLTHNTVCTKSYTIPVSLVQSCAALGLELGIAVRLRWPEELE